FETSSYAFKILTVNHDTNPKHEFGNIIISESDQYSRRFTYDLLNPREEFTVTFLINDTAPLYLYAKGEGLEVKPIKSTERSPLVSIILAVIVATLTIVLSLASKLLKY
ncbi:unnamed protein product, partial [marine sediment metagenome]